MRTALVMGDGPAGLLAAITLQRAGWMAKIAPGRRGARTHHGHVHQISFTTMAKIEAVAGQGVAGWSAADLLRIDGAAPPVMTQAPIVDPAALVHALSRRAIELGAKLVEPRMAIPVEDKAFDLLVDASGSAVLAGRTAGLDVAIDESDAIDECWTWRGTAGSGDDRWTIAARDVAGAAGLWLTRAVDGRCMMTVRCADCGESPVSPFRLLDSVMLAAGHDWSRRMGKIVFDPNPVRHRAPFARRVEVTRSAGGPPLLRIGDGLIQTAPRFGQGFAQIAEQIELMRAALASGSSPASAVATIEASADRRWLAAMIGAASEPLLAA